MAIDVGALRRFQDTWGPVIDAIPAVINMTEQQADLDRALETKKRELTKASEDIAAAFTEADHRLTVINEELLTASNQKAAVMAAIEEARAKAAADAKAAEAAASERLAAVEAQISERNSVLSAVDAKIAADTAAAQADHATAVAAMQAEITELEKRKANAEKALATLRAKLE